MEEDVLDAIVSGEETAYSAAYDEALNSSLQERSSTMDLDQSSCSVTNPTDAPLLLRAWQLGVYHGAQLTSELCSYYGMVQELLDSRKEILEQQTTLDNKVQKRNPALFKVADELRELLLVSPGLLTVDVTGPTGLNLHRQTLDENLTAVRNKAKRLISLLEVHVLDTSMSQLNF